MCPWAALQHGRLLLLWNMQRQVLEASCYSLPPLECSTSLYCAVMSSMLQYMGTIDIIPCACALICSCTVVYVNAYGLAKVFCHREKLTVRLCSLVPLLSKAHPLI